MTGMKEGAGEDPFSEEGEQTKDSTSPQSDVTRSDPNPEIQKTDTERDLRRQETERAQRIPYIFRRDDVQAGRDRVPLFLQEGTKDLERQALRELEERFGDDVATTDLREAVVKVGLNNIDEVEQELKNWGYGIKFNE